jgi:two-component system, OmpR family, sensor histidine kinase VicK
MLQQSYMTDSIQRIGECSENGIFICNVRSLQFEYVNDRFAEIFNVSKEKMLRVARLLLPLIRTEDIYYLQHQHTRLLTTGTINDAEFRLELPDGTPKHLCCDAFLLDDETALGFVKDITRQKEHEDYLADYGARKDTLLDMMSHNLSGTLHLSGELLKEMEGKGKKENEATHKKLQQIYEATEQSIGIIRDFLKKQHLESERIHIRKTRFDVVLHLRAIIEKMQATSLNKKFRLVSSVRTLNISTDLVKFFQAVHNLISNAVKFSPVDGEIIVSVEEHTQTFVVHIHDKGMGIPEDFREHILNLIPPPANESATPGGLYVVKNLVRLLGGRVWFESEEGKGSTFSIELPKE